RPMTQVYCFRTILALTFPAVCLFSSAEASTVYENYTFSTFAGPPESGAGTSDGSGRQARFYLPFGLGVDTSGNIFVADTANNTIRKITPAGDVTTLAGLAGNAGNANGSGNNARFKS